MRSRLPHALRTSALLLLAAMASSARAADSCAGAPFVNVMRPRTIEESSGVIVGPQVFDTAAHPRGFVLMANNYGLLVYDGVSWRLVPLGRAGVAFSVAVGPDGRMFAGGARTFGEVVEDPSGQLLFRSLESGLGPEDSFSDVWQTIVTADGAAYFRSPERIFLVKDGQTRALAPGGRFTAAGLARNVVYAHDSSVGLVVLDGARAAAVTGGEVFRGVRVTAIAEGDPGWLLVGTQDQGLFRFNLGRGEAEPISPGLGAMRSGEILSVRRLDDGAVAVGTLRSGLFMLDDHGSLRYRLDRDNGLPDSAVLSLQASGGSLWAGTSGGVAQILAPNPVQSFGAREGLPGIVEAITKHQGSIYAATSQGVFRLTCLGVPFEPVASLRKQAFALHTAGSLLAATADGIYEIRGSSARLVRPGLARGFAPTRDPDHLWAATQTGVASLVRKGEIWTLEGSIEVAPSASTAPSIAGIEATSVGEDTDGRLWMALATGRLVSGMPVRGGRAIELTEPRVFGDSDGISPGFVEVITLKDGVHIGLVDRVLTTANGVASADPALTRMLGEGRGAFRVEDAGDGGYWIASGKRPLRLVPDTNGTGLSVRSTALLRTPPGSRILDFLDVSPSEVWIGTDEGAFRYDPTAELQDAAPVNTLIRHVASNQEDLFLGGPSDALESPLPHLAPLRFEVSSSSLDDPSRTRYRFRLDGQDTDWSPWTAETRRDYTNLGPGAYRFRVESRDVYGRIGREAGFSFVVLRPWYRQFWAIGLAVVLGALLFFAALEMRTRRLLRRQQELEMIVDQKTTELREASFTDPLTGLRNRRYFAEVIAAEASLATRPASPALHLFLVDLDHFKQVNDTLGHAAGDEVLRQTAARLRAAMRTSDLIFRWGGEEFLIVARGTADLPRNELAKRIVRVMAEKPFEISPGVSLTRSCSLGFATFPFYPGSSTLVPVDAVIELADLALYRAKQTGRNRAVGVSPRAGAAGAGGGDAPRGDVLMNLEHSAVTVEVLEGPPLPAAQD
jgi:diguanylate cyclase (GGDEF)-like protein